MSLYLEENNYSLGCQAPEAQFQLRIKYNILSSCFFYWKEDIRYYYANDKSAEEKSSQTIAYGELPLHQSCQF